MWVKCVWSQKADLKNEDAPQDLRIVPYYVAVYHKGMEIDDVIIDGYKFNRLNSLALLSKECKYVYCYN